MPGRNTSDNKFGVSPFIVGEILGDGCNYTSIQTAINDCSAAGGGCVYIRPKSTPYVENLNLLNSVNLQGCDADGRLPFPFSKVIIQGSHTLTVAGGLSIVILENLNFNNLVGGDNFTISPLLGSFAILGLKYCIIEVGGGTGHNFVLNADGTSQAQVSTEFSNGNADDNNFFWTGAGSGSVMCHGGSWTSINGPVAEMISGTPQFIGQEAVLSGGTFCLEFGTASSSGILTNCTLAAGGVNAAINMTVAGAQCTSQHCSMNCAGTDYVTGVAGTSFAHADTILLGTGIAISGATETKLNWQPYAGSAAAALGSDRGTASFDSADFVVTDGFVELSGTGAGSTITGDTGGPLSPTAGNWNIVGGPGVTTTGAGSTLTINSVVWSDQAAPVTVAEDSGSFDTGPTTLTLPAAPSQGEECRFFSVSSPTVIQANAGQTIQIGSLTSSVAGTATGTNIGNSLVLSFYAATNTWCSVATNGNWILA